jgi:hypothetical protein
VKVLTERGIEADCFELSDRVGRNWVWGNTNGAPAAYKSLHINTSRQRMEFSDFPMPAHLPDFARHDQIADYFAAYMRRLGFGAPDHEFAQAHPTMSSRILDRLAHGAITARPNVDHFDGDKFVFTDETRAKADQVVFCTGYKINFPFFDREFLDPSGDNEIRLYVRFSTPRCRHRISWGSCSHWERSCTSPKDTASSSPTIFRDATACPDRPR